MTTGVTILHEDEVSRALGRPACNACKAGLEVRIITNAVLLICTTCATRRRA